MARPRRWTCITCGARFSRGNRYHGYYCESHRPERSTAK